MCIVQLVENEEADVGTLASSSSIHPSSHVILERGSDSLVFFPNRRSWVSWTDHSWWTQCCYECTSHFQELPLLGWSDSSIFCYRDLHFNFLLLTVLWICCESATAWKKIRMLLLRIFHSIMLKICFMNNKVEFVSIFILICCIRFLIKGWYVFILLPKKEVLPHVCAPLSKLEICVTSHLMMPNAAPLFCPLAWCSVHRAVM